MQSSYLSPVLTNAESTALTEIMELARTRNWRVFAQVKLTHIVKGHLGIDGQKWSRATRQVLDFVITDEATNPIFAIELDDSSHRERTAIELDEIKDEVCQKAGLELLRIEATHLKRHRNGRSLLDYLFMSRDFRQMVGKLQDSGTIPRDEIRDLRDVVEVRNGHPYFPNDLASEAREALWAAHFEGSIAGSNFEPASFRWQDGWVEAWCFCHVSNRYFLFAQVRLRRKGTFESLCAEDLARDLAVAELGEHLKAVQRDEPVLVTANEITRRFNGLAARRNEIVNDGRFFPFGERNRICMWTPSCDALHPPGCDRRR